jgi:hypothetical protein
MWEHSPYGKCCTVETLTHFAMAKRCGKRRLTDFKTNIATHASAGYQQRSVFCVNAKQRRYFRIRGILGRMDPVDVNRLGNVLDLAITEIIENLVNSPANLLVH